MTQHKTFNEQTFWPAFEEDLSTAQARLIIQSPFVSFRRVNKLLRLLDKLIERNVVVCTYIQSPRWSATNEESRNRELESLEQSLKNRNVHVNFKANIHAKLAIIDESVLWEGSLNILSHNDTSERMRRFKSVSEIRQAITDNKLDECLECPALSNGSAAKLLSGIAQRRRKFNITQTELGKMCGLSQARISQIEQEYHDVALSTFCALTSELELEVILVPKFVVPSVSKFLERLNHLG